jgi:DNA-binding response OmpR family regulator
MELKAIYEFGHFRLDREARILFSGDRNVALTPKAVEVLLVLVENRGELVAKDDLMKAVWPDNFLEESNLTANISILLTRHRDRNCCQEIRQRQFSWGNFILTNLTISKGAGGRRRYYEHANRDRCP